MWGLEESLRPVQNVPTWWWSTKHSVSSEFVDTVGAPSSIYLSFQNAHTEIELRILWTGSRSCAERYKGMFIPAALKNTDRKGHGWIVALEHHSELPQYVHISICHRQVRVPLDQQLLPKSCALDAAIRWHPVLNIIEHYLATYSALKHVAKPVLRFNMQASIRYRLSLWVYKHPRTTAFVETCYPLPGVNMVVWCKKSCPCYMHVISAWTYNVHVSKSCVYMICMHIYIYIYIYI